MQHHSNQPSRPSRAPRARWGSKSFRSAAARSRRFSRRLATAANTTEELLAKHGKKYRAAAEKVEHRPYQLDEAFKLLKEVSYAKFNETVELSMLLGVDPKHADQMVRGTTVLPHGTGQSKRVLVIAQGDKQREAQEAGADLVGGDDMVQKIQEGWIDFDAVIAMRKAKPAAAKGKYVRSIYISSTMSPSIQIDSAVAEVKAE